MEVGDYVRTHDGRIDKIVDIKNDFIYIENSDYGYRENYLKSSPNIIDLIGVGDYVNGMEVTGIGGTRWDENDLHCYCEHNGNENWKQVMIPAKDIKSIVTKEQFSCMEYKIGE